MPYKDTSLVSWTALENVKDGINIGLNYIFMSSTASSTIKVLPHGHLTPKQHFSVCNYKTLCFIITEQSEQ